MLAGDLQRSFAEADSEQVLLALGTNLGHVGQSDRVESTPWALSVGFERSLVRDDGPIGVAQAVVDRGNRVEQVAQIAEISRRTVDLQRLQQALERLRIVPRLMVNDADQIERPHLDDRRRATSSQVPRLEGKTKCFVELTELIRDAGKAVERLGLARLVAVRARQDTRLLHQRTRSDEVVGLDGSRLVQKVANRLAAACPFLQRYRRHRQRSTQPFGPLGPRETTCERPIGATRGYRQNVTKA